MKPGKPRPPYYVTGYIEIRPDEWLEPEYVGEFKTLKAAKRAAANWFSKAVKKHIPRMYVEVSVTWEDKNEFSYEVYDIWSGKA